MEAAAARRAGSPPQSPKVVWVTGAGGLIGSSFVRTAAQYAPGQMVRGLTRAALDLCDLDAVERAYLAERPGVVIHCAALSKSPECEASPELAWRCNVEATEHLARLAADGSLVFFSTDLVFDGRAGHYSESAPVNPLSVYARTKAAAEACVLRNPRHTVIRTSLTAGTSPTGDRSFNEQLRSAWARGEVTRLFRDEFRCPMVVEATVELVWAMIAQDLTGLYHLAGAEKLSRLEIGQLLAAHWRVRAPIEAASLREYSGAPRAPDTSLNCTRLETALGRRMPAFSKSVEMLD